MFFLQLLHSRVCEIHEIKFGIRYHDEMCCATQTPSHTWEINHNLNQTVSSIAFGMHPRCMYVYTIFTYECLQVCMSMKPLNIVL